jgi:N-acetylglutamate synthase-like GNAT family acetyltransferase
VSSYTVSTDPTRLDVDTIHRFLSEESYWAKGRSHEVTERAIANSYPFGVYLGDEQVAFARVVTDTITFAWLADVFVLPEHQGNGVGKLLVESVLGDPRFAGMKRWFLGTADAHELYRRYGFSEIVNPGRLMAIEEFDEAQACSGE